MAYAPVTTAYTDENPCPRVEVFFEEFAEGTTTVTVFRSAAGRAYQVRGAVRAATAGSLTRIDFECPFNIPVTYRAEMFDADGLSLGFTDPTTLPSLDSADTWIHNPLDPQGAVKVSLLNTAARSLSRPVAGSISRPIGRRVGVVLSQGRSGLQEATFDAFAADEETADKVQALLGDYTSTTVPVVCLRVGGGDTSIRIPKPLFLGVFNIAEEDYDISVGGTATVQRMTGDEAAPPVPGLFIPLLTNADLNAYYATNADLNSDNASNAAVNRRYDLVGFSGGA